MSSAHTEEVVRVADQLAINELAARYCVGIDRRDRDVFLGIWTEDGNYIVGRRSGRFHGKEELRQAIGFVSGAYASTRHWTTNHIVEFQSEGDATGISDSFAICVTHDQQPCLVAASYDDHYSKIDGRWYIRSRTVTRWFVSDPMDVGLTVPAPVPVEDSGGAAVPSAPASRS
ncbi:nuclear transport factor 2 family protein [Gordonia sp. i37]|uniref:nuclear transport factor 2 family protein n=1 Tax=Gordonia sp. i37 TaxID=1961707 RepID=UPI0015578DD0|nr:nuclear transport factor 2 family protein [Gordonia sp. i37]